MTGSIAQVTGDLIRVLSSALAGDGIRVAAEYPDKARPSPLSRQVVAVGIQDAEVLPCALADFAGLDEDGGVFARSLELTAALSVCCPTGDEAAGCQAVFSKLCDTLLFGGLAYEVKRVWCGKVTYDRELGALVLPCYARLRLAVQASEGVDGALDFVIRRVSL
ncbi:hypothetical protein H8711_09695 [Clostridiaceae bacterium NSJ-31]|uniref:Uncharacterized protein n=1 Tax=Ligaoa zhengdingensis TaxID=2763658 RepID=A0A926E1R4_9FIRM|nr:hypothetical protein [Ligaoa zhengdingensis]MBC8547200.1 hypothetical protein [Ligaoa zhengdingensis]